MAAIRRPKREYSCAQCGVAIYRYPSTVRNPVRVFCSRKHCGLWKSKHLSGKNSALYRGAQVSLNCSRCGCAIVRWQNKIHKGQKYYCRDCRYKAHSEQMRGRSDSRVNCICEWCGETFQTWPTYVRRGARFCSRACANNAHIGTQVGPNSPRWNGGKRSLRGFRGAAWYG